WRVSCCCSGACVGGCGRGEGVTRVIRRLSSCASTRILLSCVLFPPRRTKKHIQYMRSTVLPQAKAPFCVRPMASRMEVLCSDCDSLHVMLRVIILDCSFIPSPCQFL